MVLQEVLAAVNGASVLQEGSFIHLHTGGRGRLPSCIKSRAPPCGRQEQLLLVNRALFTPGVCVCVCVNVRLSFRFVNYQKVSSREPLQSAG